MVCLIVRCVVFDFLIFLLIIVGIYVIMVFGLNLQVGYVGLFNFGYIVFVGIGVYVIGIIIVVGYLVLVGVVLGVLVVVVLGWCVVCLGCQFGVDYWGIVILVIVEILCIVVINEDWFIGGV